MGDEKKERPLDTQELECQHCKNKPSTGSNYCNVCGRSLSHEKNPNTNEMTLVNRYADFLQRLNDNQTSFLKRSITVGGVLLLGFLGFLGVGSYVGFKAEIDKAVNKFVNAATAPEKINPLVNEYVNRYCQKHVGKTIDDLDAQIRHEVAYLYIQIARINAEQRSNIEIANRYFEKARKDLKRIVEDHRSYAKSWFELGRLDHYYPKKYDSSFDSPKTDSEKADQCKMARNYYLTAIENYTEKEKRRFLAEPSFYVAQLSMKLYDFLDEKEISTVEHHLKELISSINLHRYEDKESRVEDIRKVKEILDIIKKDSRTNEEEEKLHKFKDDIEYLKF